MKSIQAIILQLLWTLSVVHGQLELWTLFVNGTDANMTSTEMATDDGDDNSTYVISVDGDEGADMGVPGNESNIFDHGSMEPIIDNNMTAMEEDDNTDAMPPMDGNSTSMTPVDSGEQSNSSYKVFETSGELVVAVGRWLGNQSALVEETYGDISVWNVSLVDDMSGKRGAGCRKGELPDMSANRCSFRSLCRIRQFQRQYCKVEDW